MFFYSYFLLSDFEAAVMRVSAGLFPDSGSRSELWFSLIDSPKPIYCLSLSAKARGDERD